MNVLKLAGEVAEQRAMRIPTGQLNAVIADATLMKQPPSDKGKKLKISKTGGENEYNNAKDNEATQINDVDNFIESIKIDNWNKVDMLPEELETEYVYMVEQEATDTLLQDNSGIYTEICRITTYKDSEYVTVDALTDYMLKGNLTDVIPESWFISVYKVPEETADYLRN